MSIPRHVTRFLWRASQSKVCHTQMNDNIAHLRGSVTHERDNDSSSARPWHVDAWVEAGPSLQVLLKPQEQCLFLCLYNVKPAKYINTWPFKGVLNRSGARCFAIDMPSYRNTGPFP